MAAWTQIGHRTGLLIVLGSLLLIAPAVYGQAQGLPVETVAAPANVDQAGDSVLQLMLNSGLTGYLFFGVLLLFSLVAATVAIERAVNTRRIKIIPPSFVGELEQLTRGDDTNASAFRELCTRWAVPAANVLKAGLLRCGRPLPEVEKSMEDAAAREMAELRGGIKPLNVVGSVAPLVGLLGTVVGMILAFYTASQAGLGKGEELAKGIYLALITTAVGLSIAIPCLLLAALFNSRVEKFFREIDEQLMNTMPSFARMEQSELSVERSTKPVPLSEPAGGR